MSSKSPTVRRLERFQGSSAYGPKLRQLPKGEQRRILDMVTSNRGREARSTLLAADTARRTARNERDRQRRRGKAEGEALNSLFRKLPEIRKSTVSRYIPQMTYRDLKFARDASPSEIRERARSGPTTTVDGEEVNLFWYK